MSDPLDAVSVDDLAPPPEPGRAAPGPEQPEGGESSLPPSGDGLISEETFVATWIAAWDLSANLTQIGALEGSADPRCEPAGRASYRIILRNESLHWMLRDVAWLMDYAMVGLFLWGKVQGVRDHIQERQAAPAAPPPAGPDPASDIADEAAPGAAPVIIEGARNPDLPEAA